MLLCTDLKSERRELPLALPWDHPVSVVEAITWLDVDHSPRYRPDDTHTWCNIFAWDVANCIGSILPHWVDPENAPISPFHGRELTANGMAQWLWSDGERFGWGEVHRGDVQRKVNDGAFAIAIWKAPLGHHGHVAVCRPGPTRPDDPWIAQAGRKCFSCGVLSEGFNDLVPQFWMNEKTVKVE